MDTIYALLYCLFREVYSGYDSSSRSPDIPYLSTENIRAPMNNKKLMVSNRRLSLCGNGL